jgi:hypothetical protein
VKWDGLAFSTSTHSYLRALLYYFETTLFLATTLSLADIHRDHLDKYHEIIFRIQAYQAAAALDPRVGWQHFERHYIFQSVEESKRIVWRMDYKRTLLHNPMEMPTQ